ncbi:hypothetical protein WJX73_003747 [Symbiochloris irregularis]|uniref:BZIP domain-containing protein n=1 Tax=Symbiochloris irregularis TaxID=706552 RepID=A0AAW1NT03_9CHLO
MDHDTGAILDKLWSYGPFATQSPDQAFFSASSPGELATLQEDSKAAVMLDLPHSWLQDPFAKPPAPTDLQGGNAGLALQAHTFLDVLSNVANEWPSPAAPVLAAQPLDQQMAAPGDSGSVRGGQHFSHDPLEHRHSSGHLNALPASMPTTIPVHHDSYSQQQQQQQQPLQLTHSGSLGNNPSLMSLLASSQPESPSQAQQAGASEEMDEGASDEDSVRPREASNDASAMTSSRGAARRTGTQQKRLRKREKDHIEELTAAIAKASTDISEAQQRHNELTTALQAREDELRKMRTADDSSSLGPAEEEGLTGQCLSDLVLTVDEGNPVTLTPQQIKNLSEAELAGWWNKYVRQLAKLLDSTQSKSTLARITALQQEAMFLHVRASITNMITVKRFTARGRVDESCVALQQEGAAMWQEAATALCLRPSQSDAITALWHDLDAKLGALLEGRRTLHARIRGTMPNGVLGRDFAINFLKAHELMRSLQSCLRQEHVLVCDFTSAFHQALDVIQSAKCIVHAHPFYPDTISIAVWVAAFNNDSLALNKLNSHGFQLET